MNPIVVELHSDQLHVVATPNGRARYPVFIYDRKSPGMPMAVADASLANATDRSGLLQQLPPNARDEAGKLLLTMAAEVARRSLERVAAAKRKGDEEEHVEPWGEPVEGAALLSDVVAEIGRYVYVDPNARVAVGLWVLHTYVTAVTDYTPYILVTSPVRECGKSVLLEMLRHLASRAQLTGGITAAALYRRIHRSAPTMLLDELDTRLRGDGGEALRGVLNTGFHRSGKVTICVGDDHEEQDFSTYCPKVLAGIGRVWDTVTSRSIPVRMERAPKEELARLRKIRGDRIWDETLVLRRRLQRWSIDNLEVLRDTDPATPDALGARQSDVWRPLLGIADVVGGEWPTRARTAALALHGQGEDEGDYGLLMLADVRELLGDAPCIFTERLIAQLSQREDRPWPEYKNDRPITAKQIASLLGRFKVKPKTVRIGQTTGKGYSADDLVPIFKQYLPAPAISPVTPVTHSTAEHQTVTTGENVTAVTAQNGGVTDDDYESIERAAIAAEDLVE